MWATSTAAGTLHPDRKLACNGITICDFLYSKKTTATRTARNRLVGEKNLRASHLPDKRPILARCIPAPTVTPIRSSGQREGGGNEKKGEKTAISLKNTAFRFIRPGCSPAEPDQYHSVLRRLSMSSRFAKTRGWIPPPAAFLSISCVLRSTRRISLEVLSHAVGSSLRPSRRRSRRFLRLPFLLELVDGSFADSVSGLPAGPFRDVRSGQLPPWIQPDHHL